MSMINREMGFTIQAQAVDQLSKLQVTWHLFHVRWQNYDISTKT